MTSGSHDRRDCLPASRAVARHFASDFAARSPRQTPTQRAAAHGTIRSAPISVSTSTASSARSPLGIACTTVTVGIGRSVVETDRTSAVKDDLVVSTTVQVAAVPAPSTSTTCSPDPGTSYDDGVPRLVALHHDGVTDGDARHRAEEDGEGHGQRGLKASLSRPKRDLCGGWILPSGDSSWRSCGELAEQLLLAVVEAGRGLDVDGDDDVAADLRAQMGYAATAERLLGARLGAGPDLEVDPQLHVGVGLGDVGLEQRQLDRRTEGGGGHRHDDVAAQVGAVAGEDLVRGDVDLDVEVAGRATTRADLTLVGELDAGAGVDAGRDLHGDRAARAHPTVAGALAARLGDDLAVAAAGVARTQRADLTEERALHVLAPRRDRDRSRR